MNNPFNITKAVDYTDSDIIRYWVDFSSNDGFENLLKPTSLMPMLVLGSKGSGKTHLMRFFSYQLQKIRHRESLAEGIKKDGYIGIYMRCSGLNSDRFRGKGQNDEVWDTVFAYYFELWVGQLLLDMLGDFQIEGQVEGKICGDIVSLFEKEIKTPPTTFKNLSSLIRSLQNDVSYHVNNCAITRKLDGLEVLLSPSKFIVGIPKILKKYLSFFEKTIFLYLIDELENINERQQTLINTLYREKEPPVTFRLGARLYGVKTFKTLGGGEENKEGSEYEKLELDNFYRLNKDEYENFVRRVCYNRLNEEGFNISSLDKLDLYFEELNIDKYLDELGKKKYAHLHLDKLKKLLVGNKIASSDLSDKIISNLTFKENLLIEKLNVFLFYGVWNDKSDLLAASELIKKEAIEYFKKPTKESMHGNKFSYFKYDLLDQLSRQCRVKIPYVGLKNFIRMSSGIPRNLLNILKHTYRWSYFNDEFKPFKDGVISIESQKKGVTEACEWFFEDNRIPSEHGKLALKSINRAGRFLQDIRYSDLPPECSISSFSVELEKLSSETLAVLDTLEKYSFLITTDRRDKNSNEKLKTYKLNGVIAPRWELSLNSRGIVKLVSTEPKAIFEEKGDELYDQCLENRLSKYNAPFGKGTSLSLF